jgi:peptidoglycan/xylan/chitin deacetylase (PgdA/CDA1 family)
MRLPVAVGVPRIAALLKGHGVRATFSVPAVAALRV